MLKVKTPELSMVLKNAVFVILLGTIAAPSFAATREVNCGSWFNSSINRAIDRSTDGDLIIVNGTCTENVTIRKGITLDGRGSGSIIPEDNTRSTINVRARNVTITGLTLEAPSETNQIFVTNQSFATIKDSSIGNAVTGVYVSANSLVEILGSRIHNNSANGLTSATNATVRVGYSLDEDLAELPNRIENNQTGVLIAGAHGVVIGNQIFNNASNGVLVGNNGTVREAGNEFDGNNVGLAVINNGNANLTSLGNALAGEYNRSTNNAAVYCDSGYIGDSTGPDFTAIFVTGTCENETSL